MVRPLASPLSIFITVTRVSGKIAEAISPLPGMLNYVQAPAGIGLA